MNSGVYQIRNIKNNKRYIGSSIDIDSRWYRHKKHLRKGVHHSILLQRAWDKDYEGAFVFEILEYVVQCDLSKSEFRKPLLAREQYYKDLYKSYDRKYGYDICKIAGSTLGSTHSEETRRKIGAASKLRNSGENNPWFGRHPSEETRRKMSESVKKSWALRRRNQC